MQAWLVSLADKEPELRYSAGPLQGLGGDVLHPSFPPPTLVMQETSKLLEVLSRDFEGHDVLAAGYLINGPKLLFGAADAGGTLRQFEYMRR
jgi:hypothetical protein